MSKKVKDKNLNQYNRIIVCTEKDCNEKVFQFGKCLKHLDDFLTDDLPTHNNYTLI